MYKKQFYLVITLLLSLLRSISFGQIVDTLNIGIIAAEKFIKAPRSWQLQQKSDPYIYYFRTDRFISRLWK